MEIFCSFPGEPILNDILLPLGKKEDNVEYGNSLSGFEISLKHLIK
jgi:hypothetical protein